MLVDSHCHLNYLDAPLDALRRAREKGVTELLCIGVEASSIDEVLQLAGEHKFTQYAGGGDVNGRAATKVYRADRRAKYKGNDIIPSVTRYNELWHTYKNTDP